MSVYSIVCLCMLGLCIVYGLSVFIVGLVKFLINKRKFKDEIKENNENEK